MAFDKIIDSTQLEEALSATADAIRNVKDSTDPIEWNKETGFADALSDISTGLPTQEKTITITENGTVEVTPDEGFALSKVTANAQVYDAVDDRMTKWIEGTLTTLYDPNATSVAEGAISSGSLNYSTLAMENLTSVDLPGVTTVYDNAFINCTALKTINLPNVTTIYYSAFSGCTNLEGDLYLPNLVDFGYSAISKRGYVFNKCSSIKSFIAPALKSLSYPSLFVDCTALETVLVPTATGVHGSGGGYTGAFKGCSSLRRTDFRNVTQVAYKDFSECSSLKILDVKSVVSSTVGMYLPVENDKTSFKVISMRSTVKQKLRGVPADGVFAEGGVGGYMLVASSLIPDYMSDTNWSALVAAGTCTFLPLEEYTVDGTLEGELDWDKVEALIPEDESGGTEE